MKIVVAVRCYNEEKNIPRFMKGYDFADSIVVSDGGSSDNSVEMLKTYPKVKLIHFTEAEEIDGHRWNPDAPHMNYVINAAKEENPDWVIFDDMDDVPNFDLRNNAREILENCDKPQVNAFRLYLWGDDKYFPHLNRNFHLDYLSVWGWKPKEIDIHADMNIRHGTLLGLSPDFCRIMPPACLLHKSYGPENIDKKMERYNALGLPMLHPLSTNGSLADLPEWAVE